LLRSISGSRRRGAPLLLRLLMLLRLLLLLLRLGGLTRITTGGVTVVITAKVRGISSRSGITTHLRSTVGRGGVRSAVAAITSSTIRGRRLLSRPSAGALSYMTTFSE